MRLVRTSAAAPGAVLARDVCLDPQAGVPLLRSGIALKDHFRRALLDVGVPHVWIEDDLGEGIAPRPLLSARLRQEAAAAVAALATAGRRALGKGAKVDRRVIDDLTAIAERVADEILDAAPVAHDLVDLAPAARYLGQHSLDTCALGTLVGARHMAAAGWRDKGAALRRDVPRSELAKLALGLLLHDLGKLALPWQMLDRAGPLDAAEWELVRTHPAEGVELLSYETSFLVKGVVRSHHERWDASGYPDGLAGDEIQPFARVAAVADVYDAITSERAHQPAGPPSVAWWTVVAGAGSAFDPEVVDAFRTVVAPHPPGTEVTLADGRRAVVSHVDLADPLRPTVRLHGARGVEQLSGAELAVPAAVPV